MNDIEKYYNYYAAQASGVNGSFQNPRYQKGNGLGSFLSSVFRRVLPYIKSGAQALGGELLNSGVNVLRDAINNKDPKESIRTNLATAGQNLGSRAANKVTKMLGMGNKRRRVRKSTQSRSKKSRGKVRKPAKKSKRRVNKKAKKDIFGF